MSKVMEKPFPSREYTYFVLGLEARTTNQAESDPETAKIGPLWKRVAEEKLDERITNKISEGKTYAVYFDYQNDHTGPYSVVIGYQVRSLVDVPSGLTGLGVDSGRYLLFIAEGYEKEVAVQETWRKIHEYFAQPGSPTRAFAYDYEVWQENRVEIFIGIES